MIAQIRTKNPSAAPLRRSIFVNKRAIVRLGSRTPSRQIYPTQSFVEVNTIESIENSRDKLRMKECFSRYDVKQAEWLTLDQAPITRMADFPYVGKQIIGFKGHGMQLIENDDQLRTFLRTHNNSYFIEKFYNYAREYRIHATSDHSFLSWRKLRRADAEQRWFFNSTNCNWVGEDHELFQRPNNWDELCNAAVMAVRSVGLDIGAVDIRVQSRNNPDYIVCEVNSAPQLGEIGIEHYRREITNIINNK
jgi:glutathione synthase/RimK-type ligase-like ATP-grasp enzyme